ncbi:MAG TPA: hypothetical protein VNR87_17370 [Flavisolibacter sp.]|nr:hypothetical protein [Flavisolibacter sp.]
MKDHSQTAIQFSGYPLTLVEPSQKKWEVKLSVIKPVVYGPTTLIQQNKISNDPQNWDEDWFGGYE